MVNHKHPILTKNKNNVVTELNKLPAITFRTTLGQGPNFWESHPSFKDLGIQPKHTYFYEDTQTAIQLLNKTKGWAFMPDKILSANKNLRKISLPKNLDAPVNISMVRAKNRRTDPLIEELKKILLLSI